MRRRDFLRAVLTVGAAAALGAMPRQLTGRTIVADKGWPDLRWRDGHPVVIGRPPDFMRQYLGEPHERIEPGTWVYVNDGNRSRGALGGQLLRYKDRGAVVRDAQGREFWTHRGLSTRQIGAT